MILSSGIVPVRKKQGRWELLLLRSFRYWDFPKGECHRGEDPLEAALRELQEETTISSVKMEWQDQYYETEVYSRGKIARYYLGRVDEDHKVELLPNPETGIVEHHEYRWVSFEEAKKLVNPRILKVLQWAREQMNQA